MAKAIRYAMFAYEKAIRPVSFSSQSEHNPKELRGLENRAFVRSKVCMVHFSKAHQ